MSVFASSNGIFPYETRCEKEYIAYGNLKLGINDTNEYDLYEFYTDALPDEMKSGYSFWGIKISMYDRPLGCPERNFGKLK